jgi:PAS domain S-box-containing protein
MMESLGAAAARSERLIQIALLGEAIDHAPIAVFVFDADGHYVAVNGQACKLLGYDRDELVSRRIGELAVDPREALREYLAVAEGLVDEGTTRVRRGDGEEVTVRFRGAATRIAGVTFYVGVAWDAGPL